MPRKGMLSLFTPSSGHRRQQSGQPPAAAAAAALPPPSPRRHTFSATMMEDSIATAESLISRWDPSSPSCSNYNKITPLFSGDRSEARRVLRAVADLQSAMLFSVSDPDPSHAPLLVRAQSLMQSAMRRLERELHQILSANRDRLDPDSLSLPAGAPPRSSVSDAGSSDDDDIRAASNSITEVEHASATAMSDLRSIAQAMVSAGYGRECVKVYKLFRKSIVDEGLYRLGFERLAPSRAQKLDWPLLELKIRSWVAASSVAVRTLFAGERALCDHVFHGSDAIRESVFADVTRDAALAFLALPESVARAKRSPEKLFRFLDLYDALSGLWADVERVFSSDATAAVRSQALSSLLKIADAARAALAEFEAAIQRDASRGPVPGGGVHPLTRYVMNYIVFLADYDDALADIHADYPLQVPSSLPDNFFGSPTADSASFESAEATPKSTLAVRIAWLILVLVCKLDGKAERYKEVSLSYLFLANNLQYVVAKVRDSRLRGLLGDEWVSKNAAKARHYLASYERLGWAKVAAAIPADPAAEMSLEATWERITGFNAAFEEAARAQREWVVADGLMREEVRASVAGLIVPPYRLFYERCRPALMSSGAVRFAPEDVRSRLAELFSGSTGGSASGSNTLPSRPSSA